MMQHGITAQRLAIMLTAAVLALVACSGGGSGSTPAPPATPTASPTPTPTPTIAPQNYLPIDNSAGFEGGTAGFGSTTFGPTTLAFQNAVATASPICSSSIGTLGDFALAAAWPALVAYSTATASASANNVAGQTPEYLVTKDTTGNIYVVGYYFGVNNVKKCVTPYVFVKAQMKAGDSWTYTDINGATQTAAVQYAAQSASFTVTGGGPHSGATSNYATVAQVNYGSTFTVYWAASFGPAQTVNIGQPASAGFPVTWTAFGYTTVPNSR
jgi:curli biogenesis system outer membrane secretion channel CsgG